MAITRSITPMSSKIRTYLVNSLSAILEPEKNSVFLFSGKLEKAIKLIRPEDKPNKKTGHNQADFLKKFEGSVLKSNSIKTITNKTITAPA